MFVFISDLHLGDGQALEDYALWPGRLPGRKSPATVSDAVQAMHQRWTAFITDLATHATHTAEPVEILFLGDLFDLLQVEGELCDPDKIDRVAKAHGPWFDVLAGIERRGVAVSLIVGNHDHELFDPAVWERLLSYAPFINRHWDSKPLAAWRCPRLGIHAEHGSQLDWTNAFDDYFDPTALSLGSHIVLHLINAFEPRCPLLDLMPDVHTAIWYALAHAPGLVARPLREFLFKSADHGEALPNLDFLPELEGLLRRVWLRELPRPHRRRLRSALGLIASALGGDTPEDGREEEGGARSNGRGKKEEKELSAVGHRALHPMEKIQHAAAGQLPPPGRARLRRLLQAPLLIDKKSMSTDRRAHQPMESVQKASDNLAGREQRGTEAPSHRSTATGQAVVTATRTNTATIQAHTPRVIITGHTHLPGIITARNGTRWVNTGSWKARARPTGRRRFAIDQPLDVVVLRESPAGELDITLRSARQTDIFKAPAS